MTNVSLFAELLMLEGKWLIKNKDGKEKKFPNPNSDDAIAWQNSYTLPSASKTRRDAERAARIADHSAACTRTITSDDLIDIGDVLRDEFSNIGDVSISRNRGTTNIDGVEVASAVLRVFVQYSSDDDLGLDHDVEDIVHVKVARDPKQPSKLVFIGYSNA